MLLLIGEPIYSKTEYLTTFVSIIYAVSASDCIKGFTQMVRYRRNLRFSYKLFFIIITVFVNLLIRWFLYWDRIKFLVINVEDYFLMIISPIIYVIAVPVIIPNLREHPNMQIHYKRQKRFIYLAFGLYLISELLDFIFLNLVPTFHPNNVLHMIFIIISGLAFIYNNNIFDRIWLYSSMLMTIIFLLIWM